MKLYILEYYDSYTGGGVNFIAENKEQLKKLIQKELIENHYLINLIEDVVDTEFYAWATKNYITSIEEFEKIKSCFTNALKDKINSIDEEKYIDSNGIRVDWLLSKMDLEPGLYIVAELHLDNESGYKEGIVNNTFYSG